MRCLDTIRAHRRYGVARCEVHTFADVILVCRLCHRTFHAMQIETRFNTLPDTLQSTDVTAYLETESYLDLISMIMEAP